MPNLQELDRRIQRHDLLCHPFYRAWEAGQLTRDDLRRYAAGYYPHVAAFPTYLSALHSRMPDGEPRRQLLRNLCGEEIQGRAHSELWLDFAEELGANREWVRAQPVKPAVARLIALFERLARNGEVAEAWAAFYAYESQVPRISATKVRGLRDHYGLSAKGYRYFSVHETADVHHAGVWRRGLAVLMASDAALGERAVMAAESTALGLWKVLDEMEATRTAATVQ